LSILFCTELHVQSHTSATQQDNLFSCKIL